ncbi:Casanova [Mortierella sp. 14UC]|nr:Casanova [Mortierella sp. 14UC]
MDTAIIHTQTQTYCDQGLLSTLITTTQHAGRRLQQDRQRHQHSQHITKPPRQSPAYSPDSPRTPAFSPSLPSSSSTPSPSSSSTAPYTPTTNSPVTGHHPKQGVVFHDSSRTVVSNNNNRDNGDAQRMDVDQQSSEQPKATTLTTKTAKTTSKPFKIPRPANSFMLYRAENGKKYPGLVATELSAKLGEAWRREPQEVRDRYDELAEQAKRDHALKYPGYKFAPVKRGTGKRALKLAAEAIANEMAEMDAATLLISMASMPPVPAPVAVVAAPTLSHNHDHRMYSPTSPTHTATSVSIMGTRPKAQRPFKVASLNDSNVPISNDDIANGPVSNSTTDNTGTSTLKDATPEQEPFSNGDTDAAAGRATAEAGAGASHQTSRAYPQLSPPLILFREALARRSPQLASSLVAQIVINVWLGVTDELRERYEIMAESDPRFKDKNGYIKHVPVTSGTPTTASEAMMANQIAQLLRKAAAAEQLTLPQSNKRKRTLSKSHGPGSKLARIAPAPVPISVSVSVSATKPTEHSPFRHWMDPAHVPERVEPAPARPEASSTVSTATASPVLDEAAPAPVPTKVALAPVPTKITPAPTKTAPISAPTPVSARNDLTPAAVIPMPMPSPNRRQTRASAAVVAMAGYTPPKSTSSLSPAVPAKPSKITKKVAPQSKVHKARAKNEEKATPANRPVRRIVRPSKYSA